MDSTNSKSAARGGVWKKAADCEIRLLSDFPQEVQTFKICLMPEGKAKIVCVVRGMMFIMSGRDFAAQKSADLFGCYLLAGDGLCGRFLLRGHGGFLEFACPYAGESMLQLLRKVCVCVGGIGDDFELGRVLGSGAYGRVFFAQSKYDAQECAIKQIDKAHLRNACKAAAREVMKNQTYIARNLRHSNLAHCKRVYEDEQSVYIVMDFVQGEQLFTKLNSKKIDVQTARGYMLQVLRALEYLHCAEGVIHQDVKLDNIMVRQDGTIVLVDFDLVSRISDELKNRSEFDVQDKHYYVAPELQDRTMQLEGGKSDIYSAGCLLFQLLTGRDVPHSRLPLNPAGKRINAVQIPEALNVLRSFPGVPESAAQLFEKMVQRDPRQRPTASQCAESEFF